MRLLTIPGKLCAILLVHLVVISPIGCSASRDRNVAVTPSSVPSHVSSWREVTTPHFVLRTDIDEVHAIEAARALETSRLALISGVWQSFTFPETAQTEVFVLASEEEFRRLFGPNVDGTFRHTAGGGRLFMYSGKEGEILHERASTLRHELVHQFAASVFPSETPRWFQEGLANFLETIRVSADGKLVVVGEANVPELDRAQRSGRLLLKRTLEWKEANNELPEDDLSTFYSTSWLFVHWLYSHRPVEFGRYQHQLAQGVDSKRAWSSSWPGFNSANVEGELMAYLHDGKYSVTSRPLALAPISVRTRTLTVSQMHAARARIAFAAASDSLDRESRLREGRAEVARAIEADPTNVEALLMDSRSPVGVRLERARRAVASHPQDGSAYMLLGDMLNFTAPDSEEQEQVRRHAAALLPNDPGALYVLAWTLLHRNNVSEGLPLALRALKMAPYNWDAVDTYALALLEGGSCRGALEYQLRAQRLNGEGSAEDRQKLERHLAKIHEVCDPLMSGR